MNKYVLELKDHLAERTACFDVLTEKEVWRSSNKYILWKANSFEGLPNFYPIYQCGNYFSFSPLILMLNKESFCPNQEVISASDKKDFMFYSGEKTLDTEISRLGCPHSHQSEIIDSDEFANEIYKALINDFSEMEQMHAGKTHIILCGGKDSLNLALLPWKKSPILLSAEPNYPLVKQFVKDNDLNLQVELLEDLEDREVLDFEILENGCRSNLEHWRWGCHLKKIADRHDNGVVFWKGQVGDLYMADKWKEFFHPMTPVPLFCRKVYKKLSAYMPKVISGFMGKWLEPSVIKATWDRCAMLQGAHMGFLRVLTDSLVLSAYHGPEIMKVWQRAGLAKAAQKDIRPAVGRLLLGREVIYPSANPGPAVSLMRSGVHHYSCFEKLARENNML